MFAHADFQDTTIYKKTVTKEEVELFDQPSYEYREQCDK